MLFFKSLAIPTCFKLVNFDLFKGGSSRSRIGVGGDSAGGRLAAVVCHEEQGIDYQILVYPSVDSTHSSLAHQEFSRGPVLTKQLIDWYFRFITLIRGKRSELRLREITLLCYLMLIVVYFYIFRFIGNYFLNESDQGSLRGSPLQNDTKSFSKLPPALVIVADIDPLRDNAILYHEKMKSCGASSEMLLVQGVVHAFFTMPGHFKECCKKPIDRCIQFIKEHS
ncbi:carboxylic ester hydrolase LipN-like [Mytilus trossulus]|uniref:carboxylic ester hydrolase LipN-like n=1 Tax=Mytilus trossulus TaxID=6551 RepID=UPI003005CE1A